MNGSVLLRRALRRLQAAWIRFRIGFYARNFGLYRLWLRAFWRPEKNALSGLIDRHVSRAAGDAGHGSGGDVFFVQIGSNDGFRNDPLFRFVKRGGWRGITLEPQEAPFRLLQEVYREDRVRTLKAAIDRRPGVRNLYRLSFTSDRWATGISSFHREHLEARIRDGTVERRCRKAGISPPANPDRWVLAEPVPCLDLDTLLREENVHRVDLLQIDAEGFDFEILKRFDFTRFQPKVVIYEHAGLSAEDEEGSRRFLKKRGYRTCTVEGDTIGIVE